MDTDCALYIGFQGTDNVQGYFKGYIDDVSNHKALKYIKANNIVVLLCVSITTDASGVF